jgi:putative acetyltransferase
MIRMDYIFTNGQNSEFARLCVLLDESLDKLAGHIIDRSQYIQYNTLEKIHDVVMVYDGSLPVACAGLRHYSEGVAEVKRVFVREEYRGSGISKVMMALIEKTAAEKGYRTLILETGAPLVRAISLYKKLDYQIIDNYGQYKDMIHSICMKKNLTQETKEEAHADQNSR